MAKTDDRLPLELAGSARFVNPVAAGATIRGGALVALDASGNAIPAAAAAPVMRGIAMAPAENASGDAGDVRVETARGAWLIPTDGSIDRTHIGKPAYVVDDATVGATGTLIAGICLDVTAGGAVVNLT